MTIACWAAFPRQSHRQTPAPVACAGDEQNWSRISADRRPPAPAHSAQWCHRAWEPLSVWESSQSLKGLEQEQESDAWDRLTRMLIHELLGTLQRHSNPVGDAHFPFILASKANGFFNSYRTVGPSNTWFEQIVFRYQYEVVMFLWSID